MFQSITQSGVLFQLMIVSCVVVAENSGVSVDDLVRFFVFLCVFVLFQLMIVSSVVVAENSARCFSR